ncbi:MAG: hypothetical protein XD78_2155 [Desulfotomaculum sp. 46_296]|nr:MAG: hypothetical protein XD78_2155 [Desulfotomaculum sp. 46_296]KUK85431.1 MAG: hypothetical protein XE00_0143 [Desulfofundulus kuznetsovii]HBY03349.1 hypothetical protein [Desulfotomaculum sp.]
MTLQELINMKPRPMRVKVTDAAAIMEVNPRFLQMGLQQGKFPFGCGVEMKEWSYYINTERFIRYMTGQTICSKW